jgi:hypothetical protein
VHTFDVLMDDVLLLDFISRTKAKVQQKAALRGAAA